MRQFLRLLLMLLIPAGAGLLPAGCASMDRPSDATGEFTTAPLDGLKLIASPKAACAGVTNLIVQLWAKADRHEDWHFRHYAQLTLVVRDAAATSVVHTQGLRLPSRFPDRDCYLAMRCLDLNADGTDEILLTEGYSGCGWSPGRLAVFALDGGRISPVGEFMTEELDGEELAPLPQGRVAIPCTYAIGDMAHCAQPRWSDYYSYDGTRLRLVNHELPQAFQKWPQELTKALAANPEDAELWHFLGRAYLTLGNDPQALACFRKADEFGYSAHMSDAGVFNWR